MQHGSLNIGPVLDIPQGPPVQLGLQALIFHGLTNKRKINAFCLAVNARALAIGLTAPDDYFCGVKGAPDFAFVMQGGKAPPPEFIQLVETVAAELGIKH